MTSPLVDPVHFRDRVMQLMDEHPGAHAIEFETQWHTWGDIAQRAAALRAVFDATGITTGDAVALVVRERPPTTEALLTLLAQAQPAVLVQSLLSDPELLGDVRGLHVAAVVAEARDWQRPGFAAQLAEHGIAAIALGEDPNDVAVVAQPLAAPDGRMHPDVGDVAVLVPTSGTSGAPRRHAVTSATLDGARAGIAVRDPEAARGATISAVPLSSIGGFMGLVSTVWRGRPIALMERFDVDRWAALVHEHRPRRIGVPPAIISTILERDLPPELFEAVESLSTGSAPLDVDAARRFADRYGVAVLNAYGATEFGGPVVGWSAGDWEPWSATKLGSVGRPLPGIEVRVAPTDADDADADADEGVGILEVRRAGGEWMTTSDLARIDDDGFVWLAGRADDVIVRGGFKVAAGEVEGVLLAHEGVRSAVVVGVPDERLGAVPMAMVTLRDGTAPVSGAELQEFTRGRLAPYKVPVSIRVVDEIPHNAMMKPRRGHIRDLLGGQQ